MPSDTSLKILIALNAVQIFITLLLIATMASTGINAKSAAAGYAGIGVRPSATGADPFTEPAFGSGSAALPPGGEALPPGEDALPPGEDALPPGEDAQPPGDAPPGADAAPPQDAADAEKAKRNQVILRTYLNLVSRRLEIAASDEGVDALPYLPTEAEKSAAIASGSADSPAFEVALTKLRGGYEAMKMDFPAPPGSKAKGSAP